jgi:uncharacterized protein (TIGR02391 family)
MLDELVMLMASVDDLLSLTPSQRDGILLKCVAQRANSTDPMATKYVFEEEIVGLYPVGIKASYPKSIAANDALMESWQRLLSVGLIMQAPGQAARMMTLTSKGREAADSVIFEEITVRQRLSRDMLHHDIQGSVYDSFANGSYDTAVRDAFVQVEISVRDAANLPANLIGVRLMREAFNPTSGTLTNMALPISERERLADLFVGAIGFFKNPLSHRKVGNTDPAPVIEELMFASRLLRLVKP